MSSRVDSAIDRLVVAIPLPVGALVTVVMFLFAVQLLGETTEAVAPLINPLFDRLVVGDASALGLGWLGAYALGNGSVIAALALSLFAADIVSPAQLYLLVAGSRLGAVAIVVFIGGLEWLQKERYSLQKSVSMGVLAFLLTHSIYLPVTVIGYLALPAMHDRFVQASRGWSIGVDSLDYLAPVNDAVIGTLGPALSFVVAVGILFASLKLFDRVLTEVDTSTVRRRVFSRFRNPALSFGIGLLVTGVTTSVAFSLGVIVPLYNRGYVEREELIPYVLGANVGTLVDTLAVAVVLGTVGGIAIVLELVAIAAAITFVALLFRSVYIPAVISLDRRLVEDRRAFALFMLALVALPLLLLLGPPVFG